MLSCCRRSLAAEIGKLSLHEGTTPSLTKVQQYPYMYNVRPFTIHPKCNLPHLVSGKGGLSQSWDRPKSWLLIKQVQRNLKSSRLTYVTHPHCSSPFPLPPHFPMPSFSYSFSCCSYRVSSMFSPPNERKMNVKKLMIRGKKKSNKWVGEKSNW